MNMAEEAETPENEDELLLDQEVEPEAPEDEQEPNPETNDETDDEEDVFSFGDEPTESQEGDSGLVKHLREQLRKAQKEAAEARRATPPEPPEEELGPEPDLWSDDIAGDPDLYKSALREYDAKKARIEARKTEKQRAQEAQQKQWEDMLSEVQQEKHELSKPDADEAFETVRATLGDQMNALLIHTVDKGARAKLIYALGQNPARLEALSKLNGASDPIRFIKEVSKLEGQLKMVKRRKAPEPDQAPRQSAGAAVKTNAVQKQLDKMEAEWEKKGGDRSHIIKFKRENGLR
jgi:hypothetical protein